MTTPLASGKPNLLRQCDDAEPGRKCGHCAATATHVLERRLPRRIDYYCLEYARQLMNDPDTDVTAPDLRQDPEYRP